MALELNQNDSHMAMIWEFTLVLYKNEHEISAVADLPVDFSEGTEDWSIFRSNTAISEIESPAAYWISPCHHSMEKNCAECHKWSKCPKACCTAFYWPWWRIRYCNSVGCERWPNTRLLIRNEKPCRMSSWIGGCGHLYTPIHPFHLYTPQPHSQLLMKALLIYLCWRQSMISHSTIVAGWSCATGSSAALVKPFGGPVSTQET